MCGIAGLFRIRGETTPADRFAVERMTAAETHRGPDDSGVFQDVHAVLGHRRLSIIDLSPTGHQPMCNEDGAVWVTYNGEIYNFAELAADLGGHWFRSHCDTEVLLHGYEEWGMEGLLRRLRGMFAFAIYDSRGPPAALPAGPRPAGNQASVLRRPARIDRLCLRGQGPGSIRLSTKSEKSQSHRGAAAARLRTGARDGHPRRQLPAAGTLPGGAAAPAWRHANTGKRNRARQRPVSATLCKIPSTVIWRAMFPWACSSAAASIRPLWWRSPAAQNRR